MLGCRRAGSPALADKRPRSSVLIPSPWFLMPCIEKGYEVGGRRSVVMSPGRPEGQGPGMLP